MLLNITLLPNMTGDELKLRLSDFKEQENGLARMVMKSANDIKQYGHNFFARTDHADLLTMLSEVRTEIEKIRFPE